LSFYNAVVWVLYASHVSLYLAALAFAAGAVYGAAGNIAMHLDQCTTASPRSVRRCLTSGTVPFTTRGSTGALSRGIDSSPLPV